MYICMYLSTDLLIYLHIYIYTYVFYSFLILCRQTVCMRMPMRMHVNMSNYIKHVCTNVDVLVNFG